MAFGKPVDFSPEDDLASAIAEQGQSLNLEHSHVDHVFDFLFPREFEVVLKNWWRHLARFSDPIRNTSLLPKHGNVHQLRLEDKSHLAPLAPHQSGHFSAADQIQHMRGSTGS